MGAWSNKIVGAGIDAADEVMIESAKTFSPAWNPSAYSSPLPLIASTVR